MIDEKYKYSAITGKIIGAKCKEFGIPQAN